LPTSEALRPFAGSKGVEHRTKTCRERGLARTWPFWATLALGTRARVLTAASKPFPSFAKPSTHSIANF